MFEQLIESINTFSFRSVLRTNIISTPGSAFGGGPFSSMSLGTGARNTSPSSNLTNNRLLSNYYLKCQELRDYELTELTTTGLGILEDYLLGYINDSPELVSLSEDVKDYQLNTVRVNKIFKQVDLISELKQHLKEYIYFGRYSFKIMWDSEQQVYKKYNLANPCSVLDVITQSTYGIPDSYLVVSREGSIYRVSPYSIINLGSPELHLINDINPDEFEPEKDTLINNIDLVGGLPLYYNIIIKVKEFLLKDQIVSLLSIKDLIQPLLLLLTVDNGTSVDEANKLALNVENLINKYVDISSILSTNFSINDLIDSLINNIRVLPDYQNGMGQMNDIDLSKITNKISEIRGDQDNLKETILNSIAIPRTLYSGDSTKWDAIKTSQRLNSKINHYVGNLNDSIKTATVMLVNMTTGMWITKDQVKVNLFKKTDADYNIEITNANIVNDLLDQISRILESVTRTAKDNELIDLEGYCSYVKEKLLSIDPDFEKVLPDKKIKEYIANILKERAGEGQESEGARGRW